MSEAEAIDDVSRRREAGDFLRSRRARLTPSDCGLPNGFRRRTPGLRREEVAMLAGVGTTWYTWLEQGRDVQPSQEVLHAIANVLRLDKSELQHLFLLHGRPAPEVIGLEEHVSEPLHRMLDSLTGQPAYVLGRRWDFLAWNRAATCLYGDYGRLEGDTRNALYLVFCDAAHRQLLVDWETVARSSLAMFRADYARHVGEPEFERLLSLLRETSPEFKLWWAEREVETPVSGRKRIEHPVAGRIHLEYSSFGVADSAMKLIVFTPVEESSRRKLEALVGAQD